MTYSLFFMRIVMHIMEYRLRGGVGRSTPLPPPPKISGGGQIFWADRWNWFGQAAAHDDRNGPTTQYTPPPPLLSVFSNHFFLSLVEVDPTLSRTFWPVLYIDYRPVSRYGEGGGEILHIQYVYTVRKEMKCSGDSEILYYTNLFVVLHENRKSMN